MSMNPEVKTELVKRLRDPNRKQGKYKLERETGEQCCLGVLCEIAVEEGIVSKSLSDDGYVYYGEGENGWGHLALPPVLVKEWAGLNSHETRALSEMNDIQGKTFSEIADYVEDNL